MEKEIWDVSLANLWELNEEQIVQENFEGEVSKGVGIPIGFKDKRIDELDCVTDKILVVEIKETWIQVIVVMVDLLIMG